MNIISRVLWWGTCALAWIERVQCKHPKPKWEGSGLTLMGHLDPVRTSFWHCLKCGKHFETYGNDAAGWDGVKSERMENIFFEGAEAHTFGQSLFDNPYASGSESFHAWRRGFQNEARRRTRDTK